MEWDVIVVGARCAGGPTAMLFARQGYRVLLLDRAAFRTDTLSTLYIQQPGVSRLERWGLLAAVKATGCPPLGRTVYEIEDVRLAGCASPNGTVHASYAPAATCWTRSWSRARWPPASSSATTAA